MLPVRPNVTSNHPGWAWIIDDDLTSFVRKQEGQMVKADGRVLEEIERTVRALACPDLVQATLFSQFAAGCEVAWEHKQKMDKPFAWTGRQISVLCSTLFSFTTPEFYSVTENSQILISGYNFC
jgi:hypothetical protein